jgi:hypothetical protein
VIFNGAYLCVYVCREREREREREIEKRVCMEKRERDRLNARREGK